MKRLRQSAEGIISRSKNFYRWKKQYGDIELADAKRPKERQKENDEWQMMLDMHFLAQVVYLAAAAEAAEAKTV